MKKRLFPPINYKALAKDILAVRLERKGIDTGRFKRARFQGRAQPAEAREARLKAGLDRDSFAEALGVSKRTVEAWENGGRHPDGLATKVLRRILTRPGILKELAQTH